jgi:hypothetical protein
MANAGPLLTRAALAMIAAKIRMMTPGRRTISLGHHSRKTGGAPPRVRPAALEWGHQAEAKDAHSGGQVTRGQARLAHARSAAERDKAVSAYPQRNHPGGL